MFIDIFDYEKENYPFQIIIGGRGIGKTYSALVHDLITNPKPFIYMRRTLEELNIQASINPFKTLNNDFNKNFAMHSINKKVYGVYHEEFNSEKQLFIPSGAPVGYGVALSTISGVRGIDLSDCDNCFYDEFIPESHVRAIKDEFNALMNAYETINRNREFFGKPPLKLWLLSNSNNIYSPILSGLGVIAHIERMLHKKKKDLYIEDKGLAIHLLETPKDFKNKKEQTALYKLTKGTQFFDMSLNNEFSFNDFSNCGYKNIKGYRPICAFGDCYLYKKKGSKDVYCSYHKAQVEVYEPTIESDVLAFKRMIGLYLQEIYVQGSLFFESVDLKNKILSVIM